MEMAKWVVIGGLGFIGSRLVKRLLHEEEEVVVVDNTVFTPVPPTVHKYQEKRYEFVYRTKFVKQHAHQRPGFALIQKSIISEMDVGKLNADYIIYAAGPSVPEIVHRNTMRGMTDMMGGVLNTLDHLINRDNTKNIVYLSSSMVYGDFQYTPIKEEHPTLPLEIYGTYKLTCENLFRNYQQRHGTPYTILRLSGVYGPGDGNGRVIETLMDNALKGIPLTVRDNMADFTHVDDVVDGIMRAARRTWAGTFNLSSGQGTKISEVAEHISNNLVFGTEINYVKEESWRPKRGALNIEKARNAFQYNPRYDWKTGANSYFEYLKRRQDLIYDKV
jgi:nucleoside-diphosphate-sugar epimerase